MQRYCTYTDRLTFSNKPLQTLIYSEYVRYLARSARCSSMFSFFSVLSIAVLKRFTNHTREYWYMGSILARSAAADRESMECELLNKYDC